jgi:hypothetical protein
MITTPERSMALGGAITALAVAGIAKSLYDRFRHRYVDSQPLWMRLLARPSIADGIDSDRTRCQGTLRPAVAESLAHKNVLAVAVTSRGKRPPN